MVFLDFGGLGVMDGPDFCRGLLGGFQGDLFATPPQRLQMLQDAIHPVVVADEVKLDIRADGLVEPAQLKDEVEIEIVLSLRLQLDELHLAAISDRDFAEFQLVVVRPEKDDDPIVVFQRQPLQ